MVAKNLWELHLSLFKWISFVNKPWLKVSLEWSWSRLRGFCENEAWQLELPNTIEKHGMEGARP